MVAKTRCTFTRGSSGFQNVCNLTLNKYVPIYIFLVLINLYTPINFPNEEIRSKEPDATYKCRLIRDLKKETKGVPVRTKYRNVSKRLYPKYSTFEVNPPNDNLEVQNNNE